MTLDSKTDYMLRCPSLHILGYHIPNDQWFSFPNSIYFAYNGVGFSDDRAYIAGIEHFDELSVAVSGLHGITLFFTGCEIAGSESADSARPGTATTDCVGFPEIPGCMTVFTSLRSREFYNALAELIDTYGKWFMLSRRWQGSKMTLEETVKALSVLCDNAVYVANSNYLLLASAGNPIMPPPEFRLFSLERLKAYGGPIKTVLATENVSCLIFYSEEFNKYFFVSEEFGSGASACRTIIECKPEQYEKTDYASLLLSFDSIIYHSFAESSVNLQLGQEASASVLLRILRRELISPEDIRRIIPSVTGIDLIFFVLAVCTLPANDETVYHEIMTLVTYHFPAAIMVRLDGKLVIYIPARKSEYPLSGFFSAIEPHLAKYHAHICHSGFENDPARISTLYHIICDTEDALLQSEIHPCSRIFPYTDYIDEYIIHVWYKSFLSAVGSSDCTSAMHPAVRILKNHDAETGDNLISVLEQYLASGCSISRTAESGFMHRNTVTRQLQKITELTGADLSNGKTRLHISLSLLMLKRKLK